MKRFDRPGWRVYATVRREEDAARLREHMSERVKPIFLDLADGESIRAMGKSLAPELEGVGLAGLINNAGIGVGGPLEFLPLDDLRQQLEINVIAQLAVTQVFMPAIRQARGRIVHMGSVGGRVAVPFMGPYAMSKHALEAMADAQRVELRPWGIHVAIIEPGLIKTAIWQKTLTWGEEKLKEYPEAAHQYYGRYLQGLLSIVAKNVHAGISPDKVADAVEHALTAKRPKHRYVVGSDAKLRMLINRLPWRLRDWLIASTLQKAADSRT